MLGKLVTLLRLPLEADVAQLRSKNAERFLAGETKPPKVGEAVMRCLATVLPKYGYLSVAGWPTDLGYPSPGLLVGYALRDLRVRWDAAAVPLRGGAINAATISPITLTLVRLVAIDVAIRVGAWLAITNNTPDASTSGPDLPTIASTAENALAESALSAPALSDELKIERTTIDAWRAGSRPTEINLASLADYLATKRETADVRAVHQELRRRFAVAAMIQDLGQVDALRDEIGDMWITFWTFAGRVARHLSSAGSADLSPIFTGLVTRGCSYPAAVPLLMDISAVASSSWRADLDAGPAWSDRLLFAASIGLAKAKITASETRPGWLTSELLDAASQHTLSAPIPEIHPIPDGWQTVVIKNPPPEAAENRRLQARIARSRGQFDVSIMHLRRAIELVPTLSEAHFELGASLWQSGDIDAAIEACRKAIALKPEWELPKVEIGIALLNGDRPSEAREHLEAVLAATESPSTHLRFNLATARWQCDDFSGALALFDDVLKDETYQSYAHALSQAAHCAFKLGDGDRGRELAKRANDLGVPEAFRLWRIGAYRER